MNNIKYLLFDCMETLVDMTEIPGLREDALWAFEGSGNERYWNDFEEFFQDYKDAKTTLLEKYTDFKEYNMIERYKYIVKNKISEDDPSFENVIDSFSKTFWNRYKSKCYVRDEVKSVLIKLSKKYKLGVVSNFKVYRGVEELLEATGISELFEIKIISVNIGWRKPNLKIYKLAKEKTDLKVDEILFIGDDFECDYAGPKKIGIKSILLDRQDKFSDITDRITDFNQLERLLNNNKYTFIRNLKDDEGYLNSFNELAFKSFEITFEEWKDKGYWKDKYIPYAFADNGKVIANASVNIMSLICNGKKQNAIQIGTVMTDSAYRNQGLSRRLIEKISEDYEKDCDFIYLFANNTVLNFYPKFGFRPVNQYQHSAWYEKQNSSLIVKKLDMKEEAEKDVFLRLVSNSIPISKISARDNLSLIMFYCDSFMSENIFYIPDLDIAAVVEYEDEVLYLQEVFSEQEFELDNVINALLNIEKMKVVLGFTPAFNNKFSADLNDISKDILFVRTIADFNFEKERFPVLSHA